MIGLGLGLIHGTLVAGPVSPPYFVERTIGRRYYDGPYSPWPLSHLDLWPEEETALAPGEVPSSVEFWAGQHEILLGLPLPGPLTSAIDALNEARVNLARHFEWLRGQMK